MVLHAYGKSGLKRLASFRGPKVWKHIALLAFVICTVIALQARAVDKLYSLCQGRHSCVTYLSAISEGLNDVKGIANTNGTSVEFLRNQRSFREPLQNTKTSGVRVWNPHFHHCRGQFVYPDSKSSAHEQPLLLLREVERDVRQTSLQECRFKHGLQGGIPFRRIVAHVSVSKGSVLASQVSNSALLPNGRPAPKATLSGGDAKTGGWRAKVDFVLTEPLCHLKRHEECLNLDAKDPSNFNQETSECFGTEWQVIITLLGPPSILSESEFQDALDEIGGIPSDSVSLVLTVPILHHDDQKRVINAQVSVGLDCISGLLGRNTLQNILPSLPQAKVCSESVGSVLVAGGSVLGYKRDTSEGRKEVASFIARALLGSMQFDMVAIPVLVKYSVAEILWRCEDEECVQNYHNANIGFMSSFASEVEHEILALEVPKLFLTRVLFFPFCRLGTDFHGSESNNKGQACNLDLFHSQITANQLSYILFSPYYKWFAAFDVDETVVRGRFQDETNASQIQFESPQNAAMQFDQIEARDTQAGRAWAGRLKLAWLDFGFKAQCMGDVALELRASTHTKFVAHNGSQSFNTHECRLGGEAQKGQGKAVTSCRNGAFGIMGHDTLSVIDLKNISSMVCDYPPVYEEDFHLIHGRRTPRIGNCAWNCSRKMEL